MGQGILSSRGGSGGGADWSVMPGFTGWEHKYEEITSNKDWIVPRAKDNTFNVIVFGGGGGPSTTTSIGFTSSDPSNLFGMYLPGTNNEFVYISYQTQYNAGGGGGYMCNTTLKLQFGNEIQIRIGLGGSYGLNGGTTSFGSYLSALGGECGKAINIRRIKADYPYDNIILIDGFQGGNGGTGGGSIFTNFGTVPGGSGQYGGGGGGYIGGKGGIYGGNGGSISTASQNGINTRPLNTVYNGDGYGGRRVNDTDNSLINMNGIACGGGGYGGNGGNSISFNTSANNIKRYVKFFIGGGGGGWGYMDNAGKAIYSDASKSAGGGGGYKSHACGGTGIPGTSGVCIIDYIAPIFN